jgi:hypothetical protein
MSLGGVARGGEQDKTNWASFPALSWHQRHQRQGGRSSFAKEGGAEGRAGFEGIKFGAVCRLWTLTRCEILRCVGS